MENNLDDWIAELRPRDDDQSPHKKGSFCKYTKPVRGRNDNETNGSGSMNRGWSIQGRERYNAIYDGVKQQRTEIESKEKENYMLEEWKKNNAEGGRSKRNKMTAEELDIKEREEAYMPRIGFYD